MKVSDVMTREVESVQLSSTLEEAASIMKVENVGAVPVIDEDDDLVGILTDRDIVVRCVAEGKNPAETNVEDVLSHELETIEPDVDVEEAAQLMADRQLRRLPVCEDGELVGMVSIGDLAVKTPAAQVSSRALREISKGVVRSDSRTALVSRAERSRLTRSAQEGGTRAPRAVAAYFSDDEDLNLEFSDEKDLAASDVQERHVNRHHQAPHAAKGAANSRKKLHPISEGTPQQDLGSVGQKQKGRGITNRQAEEDLRRNNRVVAIREQAGRRPGSRKTG
jgi:CBS domain-containing protein